MMFDKLKKWEKTRKLGKKRFIKIWTIFWVLFSAAGVYIRDIILRDDLVWKHMVIRIIISLVGGYIFGLVLWNISEKAYLKSSSEEKQNHDTV